MTFSMDHLLLFRKTLKRELSSDMYHLHNALSAKLIAIAPLPLFTMTIYATIVYYLAGFRTDSFVYFLIYMGFIWMTVITFLFLEILYAFIPIPLIGTFLNTLAMGFAGIAVRIPNMTPILSWLRFLSPAYYSLQGLVQNECSGLVFGDGATGDQYLSDYALNELSIIWCAGALLITWVGYYFICWYALYISVRTRFIVI